MNNKGGQMGTKWKALKIDETEINDWVSASVLALTDDNDSFNHWGRVLLNKAAEAQFRKTRKRLLTLGCSPKTKFKIKETEKGRLIVIEGGLDTPVAGPFTGSDRAYKAFLAHDILERLIK